MILIEVSIYSLKGQLIQKTLHFLYVIFSGSYIYKSIAVYTCSFRLIKVKGNICFYLIFTFLEKKHYIRHLSFFLLLLSICVRICLYIFVCFVVQTCSGISCYQAVCPLVVTVLHRVTELSRSETEIHRSHHYIT